jgi:hypothetical protein
MEELLQSPPGAAGWPPGLDAARFVEATIDQLAKDFDLDADRLRAAAIGVLPVLTDVIAEGLAGDASALFAAFYRLDLGEPRVRQILHDHDREAAARLLARAAAERAAQKVWTRWQYSTGSTPTPT